jgi:hypothetical protein
VQHSLVVIARFFFLLVLALLLLPLLVALLLLQVLVPELVDNVPFDVGKDDLEYVRVPCYGSALDAFFDVL